MQCQAVSNFIFKIKKKQNQISSVFTVEVLREC